MPGIDPSPHSLSFPRWRKPATVIVMGGILAFVIWTLPNWEEFWGNLAQFPSLWQIPANRSIIVDLTTKIVSPLLIMGIIGIAIWIYSLARSSQDEETAQPRCPEHVLQGVQTAKRERYGRFSLPLPEQLPNDQEGPPRPQPVASGSRGYDPETPLPPVLLAPHVPEGQTEEGQNQALPAGSDPSTIFTDQRSGIVVTKPSPSPVLPPQTTTFSQPLVLNNLSTDASKPLISIRLLKDVSMAINLPGGGRAIVPLTLNAKRVQLLAYIAWRRGELIDRDKILEHVFGWGLADEDATEEKLSERFESHKKLLRRKIREVITEQMNKPAGREVIPPDQVDPFVSDSGFWGLSDLCRVEDLETIETSYKVIALARKDGKLVDEIPEYVREACERILATYSGDFLEALIKKYPGEFRAWQGRSSWARKPYTHYRDYYLDALWYAAEYEWRMGQHYSENKAESGEATLRKQQEYFGRAAQKYQSYAMYACNSRFDAKATFGAHGEYGERVGMSERALRRCVVLLGAIGRTDLINQVWSAYLTQMKSASDHRWQSSQETQADIQAAREQTNAYRFAAQVAQMSDFAERQDRLS